MTKLAVKKTTGALLALGFTVMPILAFADGTVQLKPLQDTTVYSAPGSTGSGTSGFSSSYGTSYYAPDYSGSYLRGRVISIPKGTLMTVQTNQPISSFGTRLGDTVSATLESDLFVNDAVAIPAGAQIMGQIANVVPASHLGKHGTIDVRFDSIKLADGRTVPMRAHIVTQDESGVLKGDSYMVDIAKGVGIAGVSTGIGTVMGTAAGSLLGSVGTGALFGLGVGALGGVGYAVARKGKEVVLPSSSRMSLMIDTPVTVNN
jgi:hypothetical protein